MRDRLTLFLILFLSLLIRLQNLDKILSKSLLAGYDSYYHLRLVEVIVKAGYRPSFDYYLNYPYGLKIGWPPLYDYLLSLPSMLFGFHATEIFAVFLPPILGIASTLIVYLIAKRVVDNEFFSQLSALIFAFTPSVVTTSVVGFSDYHIWNLFLVLLSVYLIMLKSPYDLLTSIPLTLLSFSWMGAPIYASVIAISVLMGFEETKIRVVAMSFLLPAISFIYNHFIALSFVALTIFLLLGSLVKKRGEKALIAYVFSSAFTLLVLYLVPLPALNILRSGLNYIFGLSIYLPTIAEARQFDFGSIVFWKHSIPLWSPYLHLRNTGYGNFEK